MWSDCHFDESLSLIKIENMSIRKQKAVKTVNQDDQPLSQGTLCHHSSRSTCAFNNIIMAAFELDASVPSKALVLCIWSHFEGLLIHLN